METKVLFVLAHDVVAYLSTEGTQPLSTHTSVYARRVAYWSILSKKRGHKNKKSNE